MKNESFIKVRKGNVEAQLDVYIYENDGFMVAYAPSLDLMGYGKTVEAAKASFEVVVEDFFETTIKKNTLAAYLKGHGWTKERRKVEFVSPLALNILEKNKQLQDIFSTDFQKQSLPYNYAIA